MSSGADPCTSKQLFFVAESQEATEEGTPAFGEYDEEAPSDVFTHIRLNAFPDGGIARFRIHGYGYRKFANNEYANLAAVKNG